MSDDNWDVLDRAEEQTGERPRHVAGGGRSNRSKLAIRALIAVLAVAVVVLVGGVALLNWTENRLAGLVETIDDPFDELTSRPTTEADTTPPVNILVMGSDSRISTDDPAEWNQGAERTDAIMLVQVSGDRQDAFVMSIPRDSWVDIPGHETRKINAAYSFGGPALMIETVENLTGIPIHHFAVTNFESFSTMTDALGGVEIILQEDLTCYNGTQLTAGPNRLDGDCSLRYVRQRYELSQGDLSRVQRQQNWIRAIATEVFRQDILNDMAKLTNFIDVVARAVAVDEGFTVPEIRDLALSIRHLRAADITFMTVPVGENGSTPDGSESYVVLDEEKSEELFDAFSSDAVRPYLDAHPDGAVILTDTPE